MIEVIGSKLEKYMEFGIQPINGNVENFIFDEIPYDTFYGVKENDTNIYIIKEDKFNKHFVVLRLLDVYKGWYTFRVLKANKTERVDFKEELEYVKSRIF